MAVGKIGAAQPKIDGAIGRVHRHSQRVDIERQFHPALRQHTLGGFAFAIRIRQKYQLAFASYHQPLAERVPPG